MCPQRNKHRGAALIMALLVAALAATAAVGLLARVGHWLDGESQIRDKRQALELARLGLYYARGVLAEDARVTPIDTPQEDWARVLPPVHHDLGDVGGFMEDVQGRLNLNSLRRPDGLIDEKALLAYQRLLGILGLPDALADRLADWLDRDDALRAQGFEQGAANAPLGHWDELALIPGYEPELRRRLQPFTVVLTAGEAVNVNTASPEVLAAIQPGLTVGAAREWLRARQSAPCRSPQEFQQRIGDGRWPPPLLPVGVSSRHFVIHVEASSGESKARIDALVQRIGDGSRSQILWQAWK